MIKNKLKILAILESNPFVQSSAPANRFISLINGLKNQGVEIELLFLNGYTIKNEYLSYQSKGVYNGFKYQYVLPSLLKIKLLRKIINRVPPINYFSIFIKQKNNENRYDYIWLGLSPKIVKVGLKLFEYNLPLRYLHERSEFSWIGLKNKKIHKEYLNNFLPEIDVFSIMTKTLIDYYKDFVSSKTKILHVPMTVDFDRFNLPIGNSTLKTPYIAYCGTMNNAKEGVDILVSAFIHIMEKFPQYQLYIAGPLKPHEDFEKISTTIKRHNASDRITFLGQISKEQMPKFLKNANILALARPESKQAEGGFPTKLGEYLATGNPVCVTAVGEIKDYLINEVSAFIAEPNNPISFTNALIKAISSPKAHLIGEEGKKVALTHFNKDIQAETLTNFLIKYKA